MWGTCFGGGIRPLKTEMVRKAKILNSFPRNKSHDFNTSFSRPALDGMKMRILTFLASIVESSFLLFLEIETMFRLSWRDEISFAKRLPRVLFFSFNET